MPVSPQSIQDAIGKILKLVDQDVPPGSATDEAIQLLIKLESSPFVLSVVQSLIAAGEKHLMGIF